MSDKPSPEALRQQLLETMRQSGAFQTPGVESAFAAVPRHLFLPDVPLPEAYADQAVPLKKDSGGLVVSSASQPGMMAAMINAAQLHPGAQVLEIGTATGYNAAILQHIVGDEGRVTSIEIDSDLAQQAADHLQQTGYPQVHVMQGDGAEGYPDHAPYDAIISTVGVWDVPAAWMEQLKPGGRLVLPLFLDGVQVCATFERQADGTALSSANQPCAFVYLRGDFAGPAIRRQVGSTSLYLIADEVDNLDTASLHMLLSDDYDLCYLESPLENNQYWYGFQLYLMLNEPPDLLFTLFAVIEGQKAYGIEGAGVALFGSVGAAFAPYNGRGTVHCFAGSDAYLAMQNALDDWNNLQRPTAANLCLRLIPRSREAPSIEKGKLYMRRDHYIHGWMDV